jgi:uncharacterized YigZ family protein
MVDEFRTIARETRIQLTVRGSLFIATALPVSDKQSADRGIRRIRSEFSDATHNCFAYTVGHESGIVRTSDDGEPGGTAGKPILAAVNKRSLTNLLVVVTRYVGGTKLGITGLRRAYGEASGRVLAEAEQRVVYATETITVSFPHAHISNVMRVVTKVGAKVTDTAYDEEVHLMIEVRTTKAKELSEALVGQTSGNVRLKRSVRTREGGS